MIVPKTPCGRSGARGQSNSFWLWFGRGESRFRFWAGFPRRGGATGVRDRVRGLHVGTLGQSGMLTVCPLMRCSVASTSDCWSRDGRKGRQREEGEGVLVSKRVAISQLGGGTRRGFPLDGSSRWRSPPLHRIKIGLVPWFTSDVSLATSLDARVNSGTPCLPGRREVSPRTLSSLLGAAQNELAKPVVVENSSSISTGVGAGRAELGA